MFADVVLLLSSLTAEAYAGLAVVLIGVWALRAALETCQGQPWPVGLARLAKGTLMPIACRDVCFADGAGWLETAAGKELERRCYPSRALVNPPSGFVDNPQQRRRKRP